MKKREITLLKEIEETARLIAFYKYSAEELEKFKAMLKVSLDSLDEERGASATGFEMLKTERVVLDKCETCKDVRNCRPGEEPCGSYELPESEVVKIYNGERYI